MPVVPNPGERKNGTMLSRRGLLAAPLVIPVARALGQTADEPVRIGVLADEAGPFRDISGYGARVAVELAVEDVGGKVGQRPIEVVHADHQNKPDIGTAILRRWFDTEGVDVATDLSISSVAIAAQGIAREKRKALLITGGASSDVTGKACTPFATQWSDDTYSLAHGTGRAVVQAGGKSWFFLTVDYVFGHTMYADASTAVREAGGTVLGNVTHPINAADFSAYLLQAQASKAQIIGLANVGPDTSNAVKQAKEFGLTAGGGQRLAGFLVFITDVDAIGLDTAAGLLVTEGFYWDQNDAARAFAKRFVAKVGKMPSKEQAAGYAATTHYLKAIAAAGTKDAEAVNRQMRATAADYFGKTATIREDGRVLFDLTLFEVKSPTESRYPWDYYKVVRTIPQADAFRPTSEGGCYMYAKQGG